MNTNTIISKINPTTKPSEDAMDIYLTQYPQTLTITITPILHQPETSTYRQTFMNICRSGTIYCTCLYNVMSQNYSDVEIQDEIDTKGRNVLYSGYGSNGQVSPMVINALAECNSRFDSK